MFVIFFIKKVARLLEYASAAVLGLMMLHVVADVIGRQLLSMPAPATTEVVAFYYMVAVVFLPLPFVELKNQNIVVDIFYNIAPAWAQRVMHALVEVACIAFFGLMTFASGGHALNAYAKGEMVQGYYQVAIWPSRFALPLSFALVTLIVIVRLISETLLERPVLVDEQELATEDIEDGLV